MGHDPPRRRAASVRLGEAIAASIGAISVFWLTYFCLGGHLSSPRVVRGSTLVATMYLIVHPLLLTALRFAARGWQRLLSILASASLALVLTTALFHESGTPLLPRSFSLWLEFVPWLFSFVGGGLIAAHLAERSLIRGDPTAKRSASV